ncbi:hypothetical protein ACFQX7_37305 [Luedemannella flava]
MSAAMAYATIGDMRVTFQRIPDHQRGFALVERDDGVTYRLDGGPVTAHLPHDLVHFTVERTLGIADGIWGSIAAGVVFRSMHHHSGRRQPHAADRSAALIRANRDRLQRAELIGGFVERVAETPGATPASIGRFARLYLANLPGDQLHLDRVPAAAAALRTAADRWRALAIGDELTVEWPARLRPPTAAATGVGATRARVAPRRRASR